MTREQYKIVLPLIQAFAEGKTIQARTGDTWTDLEEPFFDFPNPDYYRIKPEPREFWLCKDHEGSSGQLVYIHYSPPKRSFEEIIHVREVIP